ncbi:hypothetical protein B0H11DRAFT_2261405 [Mycena galericulata]|nr:hypothetical protein B0H11DRAFT_2261405 [Mycena galericulata]
MDYAANVKELRFAHDAVSYAQKAGIFQSRNYPHPPSTPVFTPGSVEPDSPLNHDGHRIAMGILENHLASNLAGHDPQQLLMFVRGPCGSGKTTLLLHMAELFGRHGQQARIALLACTMSAAGVVRGQLLKSWAGLIGSAANVVGPHAARDARVAAADYILIDQASALSKDELMLFESCLAAARGRLNQGNPALPFAGANIILSADMHQHPPFALPGESLFSMPSTRPGSAEASLLFGSFDRIITLTSRHADSWRHFLDRLREGRCTEDDIGRLQRRVVSAAQSSTHNFYTPPWDDAPLLTTRNRVVELWNAEAVVKRRQISGETHYICEAVDAIDSRTPTKDEKILISQLRTATTARLARAVEIGVGVRVFVTSGASRVMAVIKRILLDPREEPYDLPGSTVLRYLPLAVVCELDRGDTITIKPMTAQFSAANPDGVRMRIHRTQFDLQPGYAMLVRDAEGLTFPRLFVDLATPPSGTVTYFQLYSALSRGKGYDSILLLRDLDIDLRATLPPAALLAHDVSMDSRTM